MKKFSINCNFGGQIAPFDLYIGKPQGDNHPLQHQSKWLSAERGGTIPQEVMDSFANLLKISEENGVSFEELCMYAFDEGKKKHEEQAAQQQQQEAIEEPKQEQKPIETQQEEKTEKPQPKPEAKKEAKPKQEKPQPPAEPKQQQKEPSTKKPHTEEDNANNQ